MPDILVITKEDLHKNGGDKSFDEITFYDSIYTKAHLNQASYIFYVDGNSMKVIKSKRGGMDDVIDYAVEGFKRDKGKYEQKMLELISSWMI